VGTFAEAAPAGTDALIGEVIAEKYRVDERLAQGGMGVIYAARQEPLGREVALKVLSLRAGEVDEEFEKRFLLEAATCAKLSHPNIVVVHDYGRLDPQQGGACFMVMELLEGRTIEQAVAEDGPFSAARTVRTARDIARALRAAHRQRVIHRDLKPTNVMLERVPDGERVKVVDFGIVKVLRDEQEEITQEGEFLGSPRYMSPEQIEHAPIDARADLYSLGAVMYLMLTGHAPFERRGDHMRTLLAHINDPVPPMSEHGVDVPPALEAVVRRLLAKAPDDRFESAEQVIGELADVWGQIADPALLRSDGWALSTSSDEAWMVRSATGKRAAVSARPPRPRTPLSRRLAYALLALGVVAVAVVATIVIERRDDETVAQAAEPAAPTPTPDPDPAPTPDPAPASYSLLVESTPPGARLLRDGVEVGETPATIELESAALERAPVTLTLELPGHHSFVWTQGPLGRDGRIHASLVRMPRRPAAARPEPAPEAEPSAPPEVLPWARPNPY